MAQMTSNISLEDSLTAFLERPEAYPEHETNVDIRETHISRIYLTNRFAYKMKKPVRFDFLDFSTLDRRKEACDQELYLNRRLSPNVYLAVIPVCQTNNGSFNLRGTGTPVEWLVKMRRLNSEITLEVLLAQNAINQQQVSALASMLARFYVGQAPIMAKTEDFTRALRSHIESNREDLLRVAPQHSDLILSSYASQWRYINLFSNEFNDRVCDGRIVDGHGDLRPEHIYFEQKPVIIDCIEFNSEYRQNDILDELAFLAMECDRLGADRVGDTVLNAYLNESDDRPNKSLFAFYKCYRASVRAKVAALRGEQVAEVERDKTAKSVATYLDLADQYSRKLGPKVIITVGGLMGSGKSTLAQLIAERVGGSVLSTDDLRNELYERDDDLEYGQGKYSLESRNGVYSTMFQRIEANLRSTSTLLLDGTFGRQSLRDNARIAAAKVGAELIHVECVCPRRISLQRIEERRKDRPASEARTDLYDRQAAEYEEYSPTCDVIHIDTTSTTNDGQRIYERIRTMIQSCGH